VTTSYLTRDASQLVERNRWQLEGKDFEALKAWVLEYLERKRRKGP
jgi:hypothetical protein